LAVVALAVLGGWGCEGCGGDSAAGTAGGSAQISTANVGSTQQVRPALQLIDALPLCDIDHRGLLLDLGSEAMVGRYGWRLHSPEGIVSSEHDGATWARIYERKLQLNFFLPRPTKIFVSLRAIGRDARSVFVSVDRFALGTLRLGRDEIRIKSTRVTGLPLDAGIHQIGLRFRGRQRSAAEPFAEVDWVRIGAPDHLERTYGAPTVYDVLAPAAELGGVPHRAIALRAPGTVRCSLLIPPGASLRTAVGMRGSGTATAALRVRSDQNEPVVLRWVEVKGGDGSAWTDIDVPLDRFESKLMSIELVATKTTGTGRLMFGDPMLVVPASRSVSTAPAKSVVIVVLNGVVRSDLPPWRDTPAPHLPNLSNLARFATVFDQHRGPSTVTAGVVGALLSGLTPHANGLADGGARLPKSVLTLGGMARDGSVRGAMFTGVPTTFRVFGFADHWDHFVQYPPNGGRLATAPFDDAIQWLADVPPASGADWPVLTVIHARGGHPPWDVTPPEARTLPPAEYTGYLGPRRAAQQLAAVRERRAKLSEPDRERLRALFLTGLAGQDLALGKVIAQLDETGRLDSTLLVVTGDVSSSLTTLFADSTALDEQRLTLPLYVHFPRGRHSGERIDQITEIYDIAHTALVSLALKPPAELLGRDLAAIAAGTSHEPDPVRVAFTDDCYSARWGPYALIGCADGRPRLCLLPVDPTCSFDRQALYPAVTQAIFRQLTAFLSRPPKPTRREPVTIDSETAATLKVWGAY